MPKPTHGEILHELVGSVSALRQRVNDLEKRLDRLEAKSDESLTLQQDLKTNFAVLDERVGNLAYQTNDLKASDKERRTALWLVLAAAVGSILTFLGNLAITLWPR